MTIELTCDKFSAKRFMWYTTARLACIQNMTRQHKVGLISSSGFRVKGYGLLGKGLHGEGSVYMEFDTPAQGGICSGINVCMQRVAVCCSVLQCVAV